MVQVRPMRAADSVLECPQTEVGGWFRSRLHAAHHKSPPTRECTPPDRRYLEPPPTSAGGIPKEFARCSCRLDLNNPPTPVDGIQGACRLRKPDAIISIVGSRCGRFEPALDLLKKGAIELDSSEARRVSSSCASR